MWMDTFIFLFYIRPPNLLTLSFRQCTNNIRVSWICDGQCANTEVSTASGTQFNVVSTVVMNTGLGQHSVVFDFGFSVRRWKGNSLSW